MALSRASERARIAMACGQGAWRRWRGSSPSAREDIEGARPALSARSIGALLCALRSRSEERRSPVVNTAAISPCRPICANVKWRLEASNLAPESQLVAPGQRRVEQQAAARCVSCILYPSR